MVNVLTNMLKKRPIPKANRMPINPPMIQIRTASIRNCCSTLLLRAPTAIRIPISRVRSVTETSMMFITPIPPTSSDISAMQEISSRMVPVVLSMVCRMLSVLTVKKSSLPCLTVRKRMMFFSAAVMLTSSLTLTVIEEMLRSPVMRFMTAV